jgi:mRNA interferase RelE/StbE
MSLTYKIIIEKKAHKFIKKQDKIRQKQIMKVLNKLQADPYNLPNVKRIKGSDFETYRYRLGDFRLIYRIHNDKLLILVLDIGPRGDIYK